MRKATRYFRNAPDFNFLADKLMPKHWTASGHAPPSECPVCETTLAEPPDDVRSKCPQCGNLLQLMQVLYDGPLPFVVRSAVTSSLQAATATAAIEELGAALETAGGIAPENTASVIESVKRREAMGTTGIGAGVAIPHAVHRTVRRVTAAIGYSHNGVEFASLDGKPVHVVILLIAPVDDPDAKVIALDRISRRIQGYDFS